MSAYVWVVEVKVSGEWKPTGASFKTRREGRAVANQMNSLDEASNYQAWPYERSLPSAEKWPVPTAVRQAMREARR